MLWVVALGVGVRCGHPANTKDTKLFLIPYRNFSCEHFEPREDSANPTPGFGKPRTVQEPPNTDV